MNSSIFLFSKNDATKTYVYKRDHVLPLQNVEFFFDDRIHSSAIRRFQAGKHSSPFGTVVKSVRLIVGFLRVALRP